MAGHTNFEIRKNTSHSLDVASLDVSDVVANRSITSNISVNNITASGDIIVAGAINIGGMIDIAKQLTLNSNLFVQSTIDTNNATTGSIVTYGGIGIGKSLYINNSANIVKNLYVGAGAKIGGTTTLNTLDTDTLNANNTTISGTLTVQNNGLDVTVTTNSTSTSTGALFVAGGVGIGGNVYLGGNLSLGGTLTEATPPALLTATFNSSDITLLTECIPGHGTTIFSGTVVYRKTLGLLVGTLTVGPFTSTGGSGTEMGFSFPLPISLDSIFTNNTCIGSAQISADVSIGTPFVVVNMIGQKDTASISFVSNFASGTEFTIYANLVYFV